MWFFLILGAIVFLIMEHTVVFWVVFVPLGLGFVLYLVKFLSEGRAGLKHFVTAMTILVAMVAILMIVCIP